MKYYTFLLIILLFLSCKNEVKQAEAKQLSAQEIVDKSIEVSGGRIFDKKTVNVKFNFRDIEYKAKYAASVKTLGRLQIKENDTIIDILKGDYFQRYINANLVSVADSMAVKYSASVNSVHYFSVLPIGLNDKAVNKKLLDEEQINNTNYYKIEVTFSQNGGGEDFEDVFIYWINSGTFKTDYLAYSYNENDGKGMRFREAYNERFVNGLRFVDYNNYKAEDKSVQLKNLAQAFEAQKLKLLSKIELENIEVQLIDNL